MNDKKRVNCLASIVIDKVDRESTISEAYLLLFVLLHVLFERGVNNHPEAHEHKECDKEGLLAKVPREALRKRKAPQFPV